MQNTTTVQFRRSPAPLIGVLAATTAFLVASPLFMNPAGWLIPQRKSEATEKAISQPIYQEIAQASNLLKDGQAEQAGEVLDSVRMEPLLIRSGGYADGIMSENSPTLLLMQLSRHIRAEVAKNARKNQSETALVWVARLHTLANQALRSTNPSYDALQSTYFLETGAFHAEVALWQQTGYRKRACQVAERGQQFEHFWATRIQPEIAAARHRVDRIAYNETPTVTPVDSATTENREETHARALVRTITANLHV